MNNDTFQLYLNSYLLEIEEKAELKRVYSKIRNVWDIYESGNNKMCRFYIGMEEIYE